MALVSVRRSATLPAGNRLAVGLACIFCAERRIIVAFFCWADSLYWTIRFNWSGSAAEEFG
jgi:hypothetical protein